MNDRRKILAFTATRADYPRVRSVLEEIERRPNLDLRIVASGTHLSERFGNTVDEIERDGFKVDYRVPILTEDDTPYGMVKACAKLVEAMADILRDEDPDIALITVDRFETLAVTMAAAYMNYPIAHIQGGEVTGTIDESIRHAVTKMSHLHFPANEDAAERIRKMGEDPERVFATGCPYIDIITRVRKKSFAELQERYSLREGAKLVLFTQHPVTTEYGDGISQVLKTIDALGRFNDVHVIALFSNADAGGRRIIERLQRESYSIHPSIPHEDFLSLMSIADVMVGNSSAGIREAPSFGLPVVNIGTRQAGRLRAANIIDVPYEADAIAAALERALYDGAFREACERCENPYGTPGAATRIVDVLESVELNLDLLQKQIAY